MAGEAGAVSGRVELTAGTVEYGDSGGDGPVLVFVHGLAMDGRQWRKVIDELPTCRCLTPVLPLGAHRVPMRRDADLSLRALCRLVAEFLESLELDDVTLCFNDWCGAQVMIADGLMGRVGRLALVSCEAYDNYPPGLAGHAAWLSAKLPGGMALMRQVLLRRSLRRLPMVFGQMTKTGVPDELMREWLEPMRRAEIRRDVAKYAGGALRARSDLREATAALPGFERPVLVVWDLEGRMMPNEHGRMLAAAFPDSRLVELDDCYTLIPEDNPAELAAAIAELVGVRVARASA
jgi:pimeloyl-ACP methyl ester carboxylesterase